MINLKDQVKMSAEKLKKTWTDLQTSPPPLPQEWCKLWENRVNLYKKLEGTMDIFLARDNAWKIVQELISEIDKPENQSSNKFLDIEPINAIGIDEPNKLFNKVKYGNIEMDFSIARHLCLTSYTAVTWSIYDRLANVCGRLAGVYKVSEEKRNLKTCEDLLLKYRETGKAEDKNTIGFSVQHLIQNAYAWPLRVSYTIRN